MNLNNGDDCAARKIHEASIELLRDPGIKIEHDDIYNLLLKNGAKPGKDPYVVSLPERMIGDYMALCPKEVVLCDKTGKRQVLKAGAAPSFWTSPGLYYGGINQHRPFTSDDMASVSRVFEHLDNVDVIFGMSMEDVAPNARDAVGLKQIALNSSKHIRALCFSPEGVASIVAMKEVVGDYPWFSIGFTAHGPLRWTHLAMEIFKATAGKGIPCTVNGEPMAGVSGPMTLAGAAAVGNAEIVAGIVVNQLLEPGRPCIHNLGLAHTFDMKTSIAVTGGPENALLAKLAAVMGRHYGIPSASWVSTESMCMDSQSALEKMFGFHTHMENGVNAIWGIGQLESELTLSPAQAVIDNEMISYARRYQKGVRTDPDALAVELCREVGIAGSFLEEMHTFENFRNELFMPELLFRQRREDWRHGGCKTLESAAEEKAQSLMKCPFDNGLNDDQISELEKICQRLLCKTGIQENDR